MNEFWYTAVMGLLFLTFVIYLIYKLNDDGVINIFNTSLKENDPKGSQNFYRAAKRFADIKNYTLLKDVQLNFNGEEYYFDAILLGFFGTIALKAQDLQGDIYGGVNDDVWVQIINGKRVEFANPVKELNGSVRFFKDLYKAEKVRAGSCETLTVFSGKKVNLYSGKKMPCVKAENLYKTMDTVKYLKDNGADVQAMKTAIEKYKV